MPDPQHPATSAPAPGATLRAGFASVDITPQDLGRTFLAGFGLDRRPQGVLEPLSAAALYVGDGRQQLVVVGLDLIGLPRVWVDRVRARVRGVGVRRLLCCATHTHSGPDTIGLWGPAFLGRLPRSSGVDRSYMQTLVERVAAAVEQALRAARPARLRAASFDVPIEWARNDRVGGGRYDYAVALAFEGAQGERIATVLNHACHPETLWEHNRMLSPDFPGAFRRRSAVLGGGPALYLSGPLGAMLTPNVPRQADLGERQRYAERFGGFLAEATEQALAGAGPQAPAQLEHELRSVRLRNANWRYRLLQRIGWLESSARGGALEADVHHLRLGDVECLTAPGELAPELGERIRARMHGRHRMLVGLCDDELGYVLEPAMFDDPEYRYETTQSLGRGTAQALLEAYRPWLRREAA